MPIIKANCLLTSVLPTPVGPENKKDPTGFSSTLKPALASFMAEDSFSTASFCQKITLFKFSSSFSKDFLSDVETVFSGILAIEATIFSISSSFIVFFLFEAGTNFCLAPASSTTSIALSGRNLSLICFEDNVAAAFKEPSVYLIS